jgi:ribosomal protein L11 methyltransferase
LGSVPVLDLSWRSGAGDELLRELLAAALDDFDPLAIHDTDTADGWRVFFKTAAQRDAAADALRGSLGARLSEIRSGDVVDEDWGRRSQATLTAVRVGRITVAPPWDIPADASDLIIVIDPSTGFGTGHHETTRLCLRLMQRIDVNGRTAIDVGTGSGVLAIAAAKLGAATVVTFDDDPDALRNARENIVRNQVSDSIAVIERDLGSALPGPAPAFLVTANLTSGVLLEHADRLRALVDAGGALVISGFAPDEVDELLRQFAPLTDSQVVVEGSWGAIAMLIAKC